MIDFQVRPPAQLSWPTAFQIAVAVAVLSGSAWRAWRCATSRTPPGSFSVRVLIPALAFAASFTLLMLVQDNGSGGEAVLIPLFVLLVMGVLSVILILLVEATAWRFRPLRSRAWLAGALLLFLGWFLLPPGGLVAWLAPSAARGLLQWDALELVALVAAAALIWWSYLPPRPATLAGVFD